MIRKLIIKTAYFTVPIILLYGIAMFLRVRTESPDVLRMGMFPNIYRHYRDRFDLSEKEKFERVSHTDKNNFEFLTIGDSFSDQKGYGYNHFLAEKYSTLHVDHYISNNQIQTLINLANGDFFDHYKVKYVILQHVERNFINNIKEIDFSTKISKRQIDSIVVNYHEAIVDQKDSEFFSRSTLEFPLYYLPKFFIGNNYLSNDLIYNYKLNSKKLFSNHSDKLLFYKNDLIYAGQNNNLQNVMQLNDILNAISEKLEQKNIRLIVLPSPDKYDLYYDYIEDKTGLNKPLFFEHFQTLKKNYLYLNSKELLKSHMNKEPDVYFYDDTHWSPVAAKIIANEISKFVKEDNIKTAFF